MCLVSNLPDRHDIHSRVRKRFDSLIRVDHDDELRPHVCGVCDEYLIHENDMCIIPQEKVKEMLSWTSAINCENISTQVKQHCEINTKVDDECDLEEYKGLALSPRAAVLEKHAHYKKRVSGGGVSCCKRCRHSLVVNKQLPLCAIVNQNCVGAAPDCIKSLTDVELAFLSPVPAHGYCFHCTGGCQMQLKGTLAFMRVEES